MLSDRESIGLEAAIEAAFFEVKGHPDLRVGDVLLKVQDQEASALRALELDALRLGVAVFRLFFCLQKMSGMDSTNANFCKDRTSTAHRKSKLIWCDCPQKGSSSCSCPGCARRKSWSCPLLPAVVRNAKWSLVSGWLMMDIGSLRH